MNFNGTPSFLLTFCQLLSGVLDSPYNIIPCAGYFLQKATSGLWFIPGFGTLVLNIECGNSTTGGKKVCQVDKNQSHCSITLQREEIKLLDA